MKKLVVIAFAGSLLVGGFAQFSPSAADSDTSLAIAANRVDYSDIDLATNTGADRFVRRIRHAAYLACDVQYGARSDVQMASERQCTRDVMVQAVDRVGSAAVTARFERERI